MHDLWYWESIIDGSQETGADGSFRFEDVTTGAVGVAVRHAEHAPLRFGVAVLGRQNRPGSDAVHPHLRTERLREAGPVGGAEALLAGAVEHVHAARGLGQLVRDLAGAVRRVVIHDQNIVVVDREGVIRGYFDGMDKKAVQELKKKLREVLDEKPKNP